jgi:HD superfamily phosphodiesterase
MNISDLIEPAEHEFMHKLEQYFVTVFDERKIPSHGLAHHQRVWKYVKEILSETNTPGESVNENFISGLLIASYLHDIGMSVEPGERHGKISRDLTVEFLKIHSISPGRFEQALNTIENHDRKDYTGNHINDNFFKILSVADDLDAFGIIGVYRYLEIYLMRGNNPATTGKLIKNNCQARYNNLVSCFGMYPDFLLRHSRRYLNLDDFCNMYTDQAKEYRFGSDFPSGPCGVADIISMMVTRTMDYEVVIYESVNGNYEKYICDFFMRLNNELHT